MVLALAAIEDFEWSSTEFPGNADTPPRCLRVIVFPHWLPPCLVLLPFGLLVRKHARRLERADNTGHCESCGYDLRATPQRCPECGRVPAARSAVP